MTPVDVVIVGLGAMGSAALCALARRGVGAVGIEQFSPAHAFGSSHGRTRVIRLGYFEHPSYVPLARAAYPAWRELERLTGERLLTVTGIVEMGRPDSRLVAGTLRAARQHALPHEVLDAHEVMSRFPAFRLPEDFIGVFQPDGGFVAAEAAILTQLRLAGEAGAEIRTGERVVAIEPRADHVLVVTANGVIRAAQVIVSAGSWLSTLLPVPARLTVTRQALAWFEPREPTRFDPARFPVFMLQDDTGIYYGFPPDERGALKFAKHHHEREAIDPLVPAREFDAADEAILRNALGRYLPAAAGPLVEATTCRYTMTPDEDFIIDRLPDWPQVIVASPCSGHGFKFSAVIGEILADLATKGETPHDISRFAFNRFA
ncbi:N-methyl-L-tryptophan oxidase [Xanthobacteraceae bacterium Astr-EGSB]|uniref:N-methyl-L-tryptophan oxidase n=1 Tax=Astrobacterium formosum TaxID=3069710 RepID=UPI0027B4E0FC|nr:N-methyl-L-tryptophan oxidase [Xanthobacteraceae bacterium Astr-EGSB]